MTARTRSLLRSPLSTGTTTALCALLLGGCSPDDERITDVENGAWTVAAYDLEGDGTYSFKEQSCKTAAIVRFVSDDVLYVARNKSLSSITDETCVSTEPEWFCTCFAYSYKSDTQTWVEFDAGATPPTVTENAGNGTTITLSEDPDISDRYIFSPLPEGIFSSDGESSSYILARKAETLAEVTGCEAVCAPPQE